MAKKPVKVEEETQVTEEVVAEEVVVEEDVVGSPVEEVAEEQPVEESKSEDVYEPIFAEEKPKNGNVWNWAIGGAVVVGVALVAWVFFSGESDVPVSPGQAPAYERSVVKESVPDEVESVQEAPEYKEPDLSGDVKTNPIYNWDRNQPVSKEELERQSSRGKSGNIQIRPGFVTGNKVTYIVPDGTKRMIVQIQEPNGRLVQEFDITKYFEIAPGQRLQLRAE